MGNKDKEGKGVEETFFGGDGTSNTRIGLTRVVIAKTIHTMSFIKTRSNTTAQGRTEPQDVLDAREP